jgi:L-aminopeptidase/D-esterase-like protein
LTNTHSVGVVRDAIIAWQVSRGDESGLVRPGIRWSLPVVAETYDGGLNDVNGQHVKPEHVFAALAGAAGGPVAEGAVGGGTGMRCFGFKGGIGTASRGLDELGGYTLGALVQTNFGRAAMLTIAGVPVGRELARQAAGTGTTASGDGSVIVVIATDAPLLPHQLKRLCRRVPMGLARLGAAGEHGSGDIFLAFSTANANAGAAAGVSPVEMLATDAMTPLFDATIQATEEAVVNALVAARTMTGINGNKVEALPHEALRAALRKYNRLVG